MNATEHVLTVDLEDWFHLLDEDQTATPAQWEKFPNRLERNTSVLLDLFSRHNTRATFFILGWVAEKFPKLVKSIFDAGHHIGSHSFAHPLVYKLSKKEFEKDLLRSLNRIEDITGKKITSYRAPGFSITKDCIWAFEVLAKHGITHDSSVFPASRSHGGLPGFPDKPFSLIGKSWTISEFPISTADIFFKKLAFSGGGYFRLFPLWFIRRQLDRHNAEGVPVITYFHPRDFDPGQPLLKLSAVRTFKSYVGIKGALRKLEYILSRYSFTSIDRIPKEKLERQFQLKGE